MSKTEEFLNSQIEIETNGGNPPDLQDLKTAAKNDASITNTAPPQPGTAPVP